MRNLVKKTIQKNLDTKKLFRERGVILFVFSRFPRKYHLKRHLKLKHKLGPVEADRETSVSDSVFFGVDGFRSMIFLSTCFGYVI